MNTVEREKYFKLCMDITNKNIDVKDKKVIAIIMITYLQTYIISPFIEKKEEEHRSELNYNNKSVIKKQIDIAKKILTYITIDDPNCVGKVNIISLQFYLTYGMRSLYLNTRNCHCCSAHMNSNHYANYWLIIMVKTQNLLLQRYQLE